ncbi:hypothetical protein [Marinicella litoralis]|uniref:Uncharacterized protein n=1 Tax=Marinicella litoralis TaxID=644220 RepID=A0A4R6Y339_9GAMM|nr:hypothetical protein [Marinicella litoralis]TDR23448.1 hypothetical protein C8D91_0309 [Marinicella litoralis]
MDKSEENKLTEDKLDNQTQLNEAEEELSDVVEVSNETQVVVKKSGAGMAVFLSVLALLATAYLYYQDWKKPDAVMANNSHDEVIKTLLDTDKVLQTDLTNTQVDVNNVKQQLAAIQTAVEQQLNEISQQDSSQSASATDPVQVFDNSLNEQSIEQLTQQLNAQSLLITQLQTQIQSQALSAATEPSLVAKEVLPENDGMYLYRMAVDVLNRVRVLIDTQRLSLAIETLDDFLNLTEVEPASMRQMAQLRRQLKSLKSPDFDDLRQQLSDLKLTVDELKLTTEDAEVEESSWYSRLVTVKKIANDEAINSTAKLIEFKTALKQALFQAGLYLTVHDQQGWSDSLTEAVELMKQQMPGQQAVIRQLNQLAKQAVVIELPAEIDIQSLIDELKGLR